MESFCVATVSKLQVCMSKLAHKQKDMGPENDGYNMKVGNAIDIGIEIHYATNEEAVTAFEMAVYTAVISHYAAGNSVFTIPQLCKVLCLSNKNCFTKNLQEAVLDALRKMMRIHVCIKAKAQSAKYKDLKPMYLNLLLHWREIVCQSDNGRSCKCIEVLETPLLFEYSKSIKQFVSVPFEKIGTSKRLNNTIPTIAVRYALLRRVLIMKRNKSNNRIALSSLAKECRNECSDMEKLRKILRSVLDCWKESGFIEGYSEYKNKVTYKLIPFIW